MVQQSFLFNTLQQSSTALTTGKYGVTENIPAGSSIGIDFLNVDFPNLPVNRIYTIPASVGTNTQLSYTLDLDNAAAPFASFQSTLLEGNYTGAQLCTELEFSLNSSEYGAGNITNDVMGVDINVSQDPITGYFTIAETCSTVNSYVGSLSQYWDGTGGVVFTPDATATQIDFAGAGSAWNYTPACRKLERTNVTLSVLPALGEHLEITWVEAPTQEIWLGVGLTAADQYFKYRISTDDEWRETEIAVAAGWQMGWTRIGNRVTFFLIDLDNEPVPIDVDPDRYRNLRVFPDDLFRSVMEGGYPDAWYVETGSASTITVLSGYSFPNPPYVYCTPNNNMVLTLGSSLPAILGITSPANGAATTTTKAAIITGTSTGTYSEPSNTVLCTINTNIPSYTYGYSSNLFVIREFLVQNGQTRVTKDIEIPKMFPLVNATTLNPKQLTLTFYNSIDPTTPLTMSADSIVNLVTKLD